MVIHWASAGLTSLQPSGSCACKYWWAKQQGAFSQGQTACVTSTAVGFNWQCKLACRSLVWQAQDSVMHRADVALLQSLVWPGQGSIVHRAASPDKR